MTIAPAILSLMLLAVKVDLVEGNSASPVRVVIYEDLQCGDCLSLRTMLDEKILPKYRTRVAFVHRDFPLGKHDWARPAAIAGRWVYERNAGLGIEFRREIMAEQNHVTLDNLKPWLMEFAGRNKLDPKGIIDALDDPRLATLIDQDYQAAAARGVKRTPTVYVEGQILVETIVYDELATALDRALSR